MRIQKIQLTNYKAFLRTHTLKVGGKNLFIYGENGSGKSSLYYALKDFFQSSVEDIDLAELENAFVAATKKGTTAIQVTFKPNSSGQNRPKSYVFNSSTNDTRQSADTSIPDGNKLKSFLTYKHLLGIHHLKKDDAINLFDLLVKGVLKHFNFPLTGGKELGELWAEVESAIAKPTGKSFPINQKRAKVNGAVKAFNNAFGELFESNSPEYILKHARPILEQFKHQVEIDLHFPQVRPGKDLSSVEGAKVEANLRYAGKTVTKPHLFLNEARLSAIALSIYLGMIKRHIQGIPCKILFLDDVFIGLDISNRVPLLKILKKEFPDYQIFITTYDKPWFEHACGFLGPDWKTMEFYAQDCHDGTQVPIIFDDQDLIAKAKAHLQTCDYKAAAVYARSAFEKLIRTHCENQGKSIRYKSRLKDYTTENFWNAMKTDLTPATLNGIETYRSLVLNTFSHYNTEKHEIKNELQDAIKAVETLRKDLAAFP